MVDSFFRRIALSSHARLLCEQEASLAFWEWFNSWINFSFKGCFWHPSYGNLVCWFSVVLSRKVLSLRWVINFLAWHWKQEDPWGAEATSSHALNCTFSAAQWRQLRFFCCPAGCGLDSALGTQSSTHGRMRLWVQWDNCCITVSQLWDRLTVSAACPTLPLGCFNLNIKLQPVIQAPAAAREHSPTVITPLPAVLQGTGLQIYAKRQIYLVGIVFSV